MTGQPAIIEKYSPCPNVLTMIVLMKYQQKNSRESTVISAANCILVKKRLLNMAYYYKLNSLEQSTMNQILICGELCIVDVPYVIKIKKMALDRMAEEDVKVYCEDRGVVDKDVLYDIAGIDVAKMNRSYKMLKSAKTI